MVGGDEVAKAVHSLVASQQRMEARAPFTPSHYTYRVARSRASRSCCCGPRRGSAPPGHYARVRPRLGLVVAADAHLRSGSAISAGAVGADIIFAAHGAEGFVPAAAAAAGKPAAAAGYARLAVQRKDMTRKFA